jgi:hypothetical protein
VGQPEHQDDRVPGFDLAEEAGRRPAAKGVSIDEAPIKRAISSVPVVKPIKVTAPNSVFALGSLHQVGESIPRASRTTRARRVSHNRPA